MSFNDSIQASSHLSQDATNITHPEGFVYISVENVRDAKATANENDKEMVTGNELTAIAFSQQKESISPLTHNDKCQESTERIPYLLYLWCVDDELP